MDLKSTESEGGVEKLMIGSSGSSCVMIKGLRVPYRTGNILTCHDSTEPFSFDFIPRVQRSLRLQSSKFC